MNVCIPVTDDQGLGSPVCPHFGSSPMFMLVDTETNRCRVLSNRNAQHAHGTCHPLSALEGEKVDSVVVAGIGMGALSKLLAAGVRVLVTEHGTVAETVQALKAGTLRSMMPGAACAGHGHGHG